VGGGVCDVGLEFGFVAVVGVVFCGFGDGNCRGLERGGGSIGLMEGGTDLVSAVDEKGRVNCNAIVCAAGGGMSDSECLLVVVVVIVFCVRSVVHCN
jgi:hypothetical protein